MGSRLEKNSEAVRKRIETHEFQDEGGEEYEGSKFGGFPEYFRRKKIKLQNRDAFIRSTAGSLPPIFRGIVAHVNGYTQPSLNDLHDLIVRYGGGFLQYLDGKTMVTHIIAANLTPKKAVEFRRYRIVKPAWVVDSIAAGRLLPWENYRVLDEGVKQNLIAFRNDGRIGTQQNSNTRTYREQTNTSWYTSQVKNVAEDIDDEGGPQYPSTQIQAYNGYEDIEQPLDGKPARHNRRVSIDRNDNEAEDHANIPEPAASFPESLEITSSLENVLDTAAATSPPLHTRSSELHDSNTDLITKSTASDTTASPPSHTDRVQQESNVAVPYVKDWNDALERQYSAGKLRTRKRSRSPTSDFPSKLAKRDSNEFAAQALTAEEHNALLLQDPHVRKSTTANPDFLRQYYSESRLHHLSSWKAELKARLQQMSADLAPSQRPMQKRRPGARRYIMHVDFDSFFCAVSLKKAPQFADKPAVVAHGSGPGSEIASCNYPARTFGIKNGMWMKHALKMCADIKVLPYDFPAYEEASKSFYEAILDIGGVVQSVSVDEALVDISALVQSTEETGGHVPKENSISQEQEMADSIALKLREKIKEKTGCAVSIGIGNNILLAKVALRKAKPAGQHQIKPDDILGFLGDLTLPDLPGVAHSITGKLTEIGITYVKDVRTLTKDRLMTVLGPKTGEKIWDYAYGIDKTEVGEQVIRKSVSAEVNWGIRFISQPEAEEFVMNLCRELSRRLLDAGVKGRQMTFKIMRKAADAPLDPPKNLGHGKCDTFNKSIVLGVATNSGEIVGREAVSILRSYGFSPGELRGLGVQMTKLEPLKPSGPIDGSQQKIAFNRSKARTTPGASKAAKEDGDPIDDYESPVKPKEKQIHPAMAVIKANEDHEKMIKPLNVTGTQFILPSQIDPRVLEELPPDIRQRLLAQGISRAAISTSAENNSLARDSDVVADSTFMPSQLDPEVFEALPQEMKKEVLAAYPSRTNTAKAQSLLPQSPRKARSLILTKKQTTPTKRGSLLSRSRGRSKKTDSSSSNMLQSNFDTKRLLAKHEMIADSDAAHSDADAELDVDFLAALPEDMRAEVVAEHKRNQLSRKSGLMMSTTASKRRKPAANNGADHLIQRKLRLPARPPKPTFTTMNLSSLVDLREMLQEWHAEFREDGPHQEDVGAIERYLRRVVLEEKSLGKVYGVLRWLEYLHSDGEQNSRGFRAWEAAMDGMREMVQEAVQERGIGRMVI